MSEQDKVEIKPIEFTEKDLEMSKYFSEPCIGEIEKIYMDGLGITQEQFEELKNRLPKTSDQYNT